MTNAPSKAQSRAPARGRENKPMPVTGVMQQQGNPMLDPTYMTTRGRSQPSTKAHAKRCCGAKGWKNNNKTPSKRKDGPTAGALNANNNRKAQNRYPEEGRRRKATYERITQQIPP